MKSAIRALAAAIGCAAASLALAGSVAPPFQVGGAFSVRVVSLKEARFAATVRQQYDFSCGAAAVASLLTHQYRRPTSEQQVLEGMLSGADLEKVRRDGFSMLDMKRFLATEGFDADGFEASAAELEAAGIPAIAVVSEHGYNHFVVVRGVRGGRVLVADPATGARAMSVAAFEASRAHDILFVIGNRREEALFNRAEDWAAAPLAPMAEAIRAFAGTAGVWRSGSDF